MIFFVVISVVVFYLVLKIQKVWWYTQCGSKVCLIGKTALVTGGNSGIGYQVVLALAQRGCRVIIADKCADKNLIENIYKETHNRNVVYKHVDLSSFKSVREFAENIVKDEKRLDILINNAGIGRSVAEATEDGLDLVMQVNYFSPFLLTRLLEDLMKKTGGRIIFTSSLLGYLHNFSLGQLKEKGAADTMYSYSNSKLCTIMASDLFAESLRKFGVTSNSYHPGMVYTNIFSGTYQHYSINFVAIFVKFVEICAFFCGKTAEEGAQTVIYLACANEVEDITGNFFFDTRITPKPKLAHDKSLCHAVWEATEKIVEVTSS